MNAFKAAGPDEVVTDKMTGHANSSSHADAETRSYDKKAPAAPCNLPTTELYTHEYRTTW
jgi:hypothetical protein